MFRYFRIFHHSYFTLIRANQSKRKLIIFAFQKDSL